MQSQTFLSAALISLAFAKPEHKRDKSVWFQRTPSNNLMNWVQILCDHCEGCLHTALNKKVCVDNISWCTGWCNIKCHNSKDQTVHIIALADQHEIFYSCWISSM